MNFKLIRSHLTPPQKLSLQRKVCKITYWIDFEVGLGGSTLSYLTKQRKGLDVDNNFN